jgi:hypothetical protein
MIFIKYFRKLNVLYMCLFAIILLYFLGIDYRFELVHPSHCPAITLSVSRLTKQCNKGASVSNGHITWFQPKSSGYKLE